MSNNQAKNIDEFANTQRIRRANVRRNILLFRDLQFEMERQADFSISSNLNAHEFREINNEMNRSFAAARQADRTEQRAHLTAAELNELNVRLALGRQTNREAQREHLTAEELNELNRRLALERQANRAAQRELLTDPEINELNRQNTANRRMNRVLHEQSLHHDIMSLDDIV